MFSGTWRNDQGSGMELHQEGDIITGVYITKIGNDLVVEKRHPLIGRSVGPLIGLIVTWPAASSITSWTGRLVIDAAGQRSIHTVWHLARENIAGDPPRPAQPWETFLTYASVFRPVPEAVGVDQAASRPG